MTIALRIQLAGEYLASGRKDLERRMIFVPLCCDEMGCMWSLVLPVML